MGITLSYHRSDKGDGQFNEDTYGATKSMAWLLDGATGLDSLLIENRSAANWFVNTFSDVLKILSNELTDISSMDLLRQVSDKVRDLYQQQIKNCPADTLPPSSTLVMVREFDEKIEICALGDSRAIFDLKESGITTFGSSPIEDFDNEVLQKLESLRLEDPNISLPLATEHLHSDLMTIRQRKNTANGYWVLCPVDNPFDHMQVIQLEKDEIVGGEILVATDGFLRLSEVFGHCDNGHLLRMNDSQLGATFEKLRQLEKGDQSAIHYPRLKCSDDATCLRVDIL